MKLNINMKPKQTMSLIFIPGTLALWWAGLILVSLRCDTTEPPNNASLLLSVEDVSCTEAWIMLKLTNISLPTEVTLYNNNSVAQNNILCYGDTVLYVDSLLPKQTYTFQIASIQHHVSSNQANATTLDTTSHNFTFQSWTFGTIGSSTLYDVAIIDENDIWAVGEINVADTSINGYTTYNAVHWNGAEWELKKIYTYSACSSVDYAPLKSIYAFSENSLVVTSGGGMWWYDGTTWKAECSINPLLTGAINKLWGSSSNDLYAVGNNGNIAHWNGRKWTKIESGTNVDLLDVWGTIRSDKIFVSGYSTDLSKSILILLKNNTSETIWENYTISGTPPYGNLIYSITGSTNNLFVASNQGVYKNNFLINYPSQKIFTVPRRVYKVLATNINDIYTVGDRSNIWHFNGISKKVLFANLSVPSPLYSAAIKENIFVAVGMTIENVIYHQATIIILKKI